MNFHALGDHQTEGNEVHDRLDAGLDHNIGERLHGLGRHRHDHDVDGELLERQANGKLARMVLQVHDELIFELPADELDEVRAVAQRLMPSLELAVPLVLDEKWGRSWGELE